MKVVKGDERVGLLPRKFSRIVWYFLARSGKISVEVISRRRCGRMEVLNLRWLPIVLERARADFENLAHGASFQSLR